MTAVIPAFLLIFAGPAGCAPRPDEFLRPRIEENKGEHVAVPPAPPIPEGEALYQMLYADEFGEEARALGQRARILAWLYDAQLTEEQLESVILLSQKVSTIVAEDTSERLSLGPVEREHYGPIYESLIASFSGNGTLSAADLQAHAASLRLARQKVYADRNPHRMQYERARAALGLVGSWVQTLTDEQRKRIGNVRFFLRRGLSPLARPGHYESMIAGTWDAGDFDTLQFSGRSPNESAMDIGGLWSAEHYRVRPGEHLTEVQTQAIMAKAVVEPGFVQAVEVALKRREALSFED